MAIIELNEFELTDMMSGGSSDGDTSSRAALRVSKASMVSNVGINKNFF